MAGVQDRTVNVWDDRIKAHVKVAGAGPALVFLHGGWGPQWTPFHDALAREFTLYAPDHPGTSDGDPESHRSLDDMWDLALFYEELFDKLALDKPALVGHSFGGMVAMAYATRHPDHPSKLILASTAAQMRIDRSLEVFERLGGKEAEEIARRFFEDPSPAVMAVDC